MCYSGASSLNHVVMKQVQENANGIYTEKMHNIQMGNDRVIGEPPDYRTSLIKWLGYGSWMPLNPDRVYIGSDVLKYTLTIHSPQCNFA